MSSILRATIFIAALALLPAALVACNSSGKLSLEDYFAEVEKLDTAQTEQQDEIDSEYEDKLNPAEFTDQVTEDFVDYFEASRGAAQDFVDELKDLDPPDEAADAHDEAVDAFDACLEETGRIVDDIGDADSFEELGAVFEDQSVTDACDRTTATCEALQGIADENDIEVDLDCGE